MKINTFLCFNDDDNDGDQEIDELIDCEINDFLLESKYEENNEEYKRG